MDDVRLPEFDVGDREDARTHGRRSGQSSRVEFITRGDRRRVWAVEQKRAIALESMDLEGAPSDVARRYGISSGLLYTWRRQMMEASSGRRRSLSPGLRGWTWWRRYRGWRRRTQFSPRLTRNRRFRLCRRVQA